MLIVLQALGFCVPMLSPLSCAALYFHAAVFKWANLPLTRHCMPSTRYLWVSIFLGIALEAWLYHEASLHGVWLIMLGCPLAALCMLGLSRTTQYRKWCQLRVQGVGAMPVIGVELQAPLLETGDVEKESPTESVLGKHESVYEPPEAVFS